jgi:hypothetical protein
MNNSMSGATEGIVKFFVSSSNGAADAIDGKAMLNKRPRPKTSVFWFIRASPANQAAPHLESSLLRL